MDPTWRARTGFDNVACGYVDKSVDKPAATAVARKPGYSIQHYRRMFKLAGVRFEILGGSVDRGVIG